MAKNLFLDGLKHFQNQEFQAAEHRFLNSLELAPNIRVNAIAPGWIETPFTLQGLALAGDPIEYRRKVEEMHALSRVGSASEIAAVIYFLTTKEASFITGSIITADGGYLIKN